MHVSKYAPCLAYFSKCLKVPIEQLLLPVIISSAGKSEVGICTQLVLLFQHLVLKGAGKH